MALDKKSRGDSIRFVTIKEIGECDRVEGVTEAQLRVAYEKVLS